MKLKWREPLKILKDFYEAIGIANYYYIRQDLSIIIVSDKKYKIPQTFKTLARAKAVCEMIERG